MAIKVLPTYICTYLRKYVPAYEPTYVPAYVPTYLYTLHRRTLQFSLSRIESELG